MALWCLSLLSLVRGEAGAQGDLAFSQQVWSTEEGLPDASVHQILQTRDGYLWLATEGGVARFDGSSFRVFRHETEPAFLSNDVSAIAQDTSGDLWFGTADGLVREHAMQFRRYAERDGLPSGRIVSLAAAGDGSVLVLTGSGVLRFAEGQFAPITPEAWEISALAPAPGGAVWLFSAKGEVRRYAHGTLARESVAVPAGQAVLGLQYGGRRDLWVQTDRGVYMLSPQLHRLLPAGPDAPRVTALFVDAQGAAWIGTRHGLWSVRPGQSALAEPVAALRNESILTLTGDREGDLWIGTEASGLHVLRPRKFRNEPAAAGEAITSVMASRDGDLWFGTRDTGVHRIRDGVADQPIPATRLTSSLILSLARGDRGDLWAGTPDGLNHLTGAGAVQTYTSADGLPDDFVRSLLVDSRGTVWAGTRRGLAHMDHKTIATLTRANGLPSDSIGPLLEVRREGTAPNEAAVELWIGTSAGLSHLQDGRLRSYSVNGQSSGNIVTALAQDGADAVWVAVHERGLFHGTDGHFDPVVLQGLPREISSLLADREGYLWMRGPRAVYRASIASLRRCTQAPQQQCPASLDSFNAADGLPSDSVVAEGTPQITADGTGKLWFATPKGIGITDPATLPINRVPPPVVLQGLTVDGAEMPLSAHRIELGPGHGRFTFAYAALSYTLPSKIRYRYKLEGFDRDWIEAGTSRVAYYTGLPPGRYRFWVQAENNDGVWNRTGAELDLRVLPPLYRRWWFVLLVLGVAAALVVAVLRLRDRAVQRRFALVLEERNRMAREIHDTLAQDFVSVSLQLDLASTLLRSDRYEQAAAQLKATRQLVKEGLAAARQSIWNLRANAGEDSLPTRLSALVGRYGANGGSPRLTVGGAFRPLPSALETEVLRIAQESLSNVDRHAAAAEVHVELRYETERLSLRVRDDGRGFSPQTATQMEGHYGLRGMHERAAALGAELKMISSPGEGTTVTLLVPLPVKDVIRS